jgi:hypothetical protein
LVDSKSDIEAVAEPLNRCKTVGLFASALLLALVMGDIAFRIYERTFLAVAMDIRGDTIDLASLNYNDTEISRNKENEEFRILSFGDSFAYSITKYPYSYHGVAANLINATDSSMRVRIVNLGEPGVSFYQYMKAYDHWSRYIDHDAVIFNIYLGNDLLDVAYKYVPDDAPINRRFEKQTLNIQTGTKRLPSVPRKFPLRMMDYFYAYYVMFQYDDERWKIRAEQLGPYNLALGSPKPEKVYEVAKKQLDNFDRSKLPQLAKGYKVLIEFISIAGIVSIVSK